MSKLNITPSTMGITVREFETMVAHAAMANSQVRQEVYRETNWQLEVLVGFNPLTTRFKCYTTSSQALPKGQNVGDCTFDITLNTSGTFETQYTPSMNEVLGNYGCSLIPYTQMLPLTKAIMERACSLAQVVHTSAKVHNAIQGATPVSVATTGNIGSNQVINSDGIGTNEATTYDKKDRHKKSKQERYAEARKEAAETVLQRNSTTGILADKKPVKQKSLAQRQKSGLIGMFKR